MRGKSVQAVATEIEWRRMADYETYYPLRDGPRLQVGNSALQTMARYIPSEQLALGWRTAALHARLHSGMGRGKGEVTERVQGGPGAIMTDVRIREMGDCVRELAVLEIAARGVGADGHGVYRGICRGWTQATTMRVIGYPQGSKVTFRRLFQQTLEAMQAAHDRFSSREALDTETSEACMLVA